MTSLSQLSTSAQKFTPPAAQNLKFAIGSIWRKPASINLIEEYGAPASLSLPKFIPSRLYIQPILLYSSETWAFTRALKHRIAAFDNLCLRRILRIPYTAHVTNADVRLRAGSPPQLLPLIQTIRLRFFGHVARMSDSQDTFRALHTSIRGLPEDWRRRRRHIVKRLHLLGGAIQILID